MSCNIDPHYVHRLALYKTFETPLQHAIATRRHELLTVVLYGAAGSGKTQLARKYVLDHFNDYGGCFWINASCRETIENDFASLHHLAHIKDTSVSEYFPSLEGIVSTVKAGNLGSAKPHVFVFDGVEDVDDLPGKGCFYLRDYLPTSPRTQIIITTRHSFLGTLATSEPVKVGGLKRWEALEVFGKSSGLTNATQNQTAELIVAHLNFSATAIHKAGEDVRSSKLLSNLSFYLLMLHTGQTAVHNTVSDQFSRVSESLEIRSLHYNSLIYRTLETHLLHQTVRDFLRPSAHTLHSLYGGPVDLERQSKRSFRHKSEFFGCAVLLGGVQTILYKKHNSKAVDCHIHLANVKSAQTDPLNKVEELLSSPLASKLLKSIPKDQYVRISVTYSMGLAEQSSQSRPSYPIKITCNASPESELPRGMILGALKNTCATTDRHFLEPPSAVPTEARSSMEGRQQQRQPNSLTNLASLASARFLSRPGRFFHNLAFWFSVRLDPIPRGMKRIQWTCSCGRNLYDGLH